MIRLLNRNWRNSFFSRAILATTCILLACGLLPAQKVTNVRLSQHPELRYYQVTFDLKGKTNQSYQIKAVPCKGKRALEDLNFISGSGVSHPCKPGKDLQIFWAADLEGFETEGWQFKLSAVAIPLNMVWVEGGSFLMGSNYGDDDEKPVHKVTASSFLIGKHEVTQSDWRAVMGSNPSKWKGNSLPVERVSWYDAVEYCNQLSQKEGLTPCYSGSGVEIMCNWKANGYRLPTEAEWEYAAKGGSLSKRFTYSGSNDLGIVGWHSGNSGSKTHAVGLKKPNELGIHDMSGNVWEWCWDRYEKLYYAKSVVIDPRGSDSGLYRVLRGGAWYFAKEQSEVSYRNANVTETKLNRGGFRIVRGYF